MTYSGELIQAKRRTEGTEVVEHEQGKDTDSPAYRSASYRRQIEDVDLLRAVYGGTKTMRAKRENFLPRHPMEPEKKYEDRVKQALAFNALSKTTEGLVGMVFRRDPVLSDDMPASIASHLEDIDRRGNALPIFARRVAENAMIDGHTWVHVESPREAASVRNRAEERAAGIRPYWINVLKEDAINWRYEMRAGRPVLTLFAYREGATEPQGSFGERHIERIRVLREDGAQIRGELWELQKNADDKRHRWVIVDEYALTVPEIPVVFVPAHKTESAGESTPPLCDLAYEQIEHYRVRSDRQKSLTFSSISVPWLFGERVADESGNPRVQWGPDGMMVLNDPTAKTGMLETQGHGLDATKEELQDIEARMASLGISMLVKRPSPSPQTATEQILDKSQDDAALVVFAKLVEDALNQALTMHGAYMGESGPGTVTINRDFHTQLIDPQLVKELRELVGSSQLSLETMWDMLVEGELLPEDFDAEQEKERIASEDVLRLEGEMQTMFGGVDG